jgi:NitT/TauT family transport system permease protein
VSLINLSAVRLPHRHLRGKSSWLRQFGFELLAFFIIVAVLMSIAWAVSHMIAPISQLQQLPISLDPRVLPGYALRTTLRMLIAVVFSLVFSLIYATLAAKNKRAELIMIPLLDILQSVPVLGYISFTVTAFVALFPFSILGVELAVIFAIFTAQAWNMTFSLYQSLRNIPNDLEEAAYVFRLSGWQKFWRVELPFAMPGLIWNTMMSMSGSWFFIVASEAITLGHQQISLPGIGSYIALAITQKNLACIGYVIMVMAVVIFLYDQLLFRPLVAWSDKFRYELTGSVTSARSWVLTLFRNSKLIATLMVPFRRLLKHILQFKLLNLIPSFQPVFSTSTQSKIIDYLWTIALGVLGLVAAYFVVMNINATIGWVEVGHVLLLAGATLLRVIILIILASLVWVPVGVYIGLRPKWAQRIQPLAQFLAAFPANLVFPLAVIWISDYALNPNIWLSPLIILGTQWYILFNVIAGASVFPTDLREAADNFKVGGWLWWRKVILPGIFPYFLTGAITAWGGAWNASIVAEAVHWGNQHFTAFGVGAYIAQMTTVGDFHRIVLGIGIMSLFVVVFNRLLWRPLYEWSAKKLRLD